MEEEKPSAPPNIEARYNCVNTGNDMPDMFDKQKIADLQDQLNKLENWASGACQELQECLDAAHEAGDNIPSIQELLNDHQKIMEEMGLSWKQTLINDETIPAGILKL